MCLAAASTVVTAVTVVTVVSGTHTTGALPPPTNPRDTNGRPTDAHHLPRVRLDPARATFTHEHTSAQRV
jgi:hypothetical protein